MKILAISDTHGDISKAKKIWASVDDPDLVLHMGDHYSDALRLADSIKTPVIAVPGNMDPELDAPLNQISALSGKLGMLPGVSSKTVYSKEK